MTDNKILDLEPVKKYNLSAESEGFSGVMNMGVVAFVKRAEMVVPKGTTDGHKDREAKLAEVYAAIARNVTRLRGAMTQEELARKAGVGRSTVNAVEQGEGCSLANLVKLADALGVAPADLFITADQEKSLNAMTIKLLEKLTESLKK